MTETGKQIAELMADSGKSAADMTHAMKVLGNGSMQQGFARIAMYFSEEEAMAEAKGLARGRIEGGVAVGIGLTLLGLISAIIKRHRKKKMKHEAEGQIILSALETEVADENGDSVQRASEDKAEKESIDVRIEESDPGITTAEI